MTVCQEKYYTLTAEPVTFGEAAGECDSICPGSSVLCPENQSEIIDVYSNLVVLNYQVDSDLNWGKLEEDGMSLWTGIKFDEREPDRFYCSDNLTFDTFNYTWDKYWFSVNYGDEYHYDEHNSNYDKKCITIGIDLKWENSFCADSNKKRAVCVTVEDKSAEPGYHPMNKSVLDKLFPLSCGRRGRCSIQPDRPTFSISFVIMTIILIFVFCCLCVFYKKYRKRELAVANDPFLSSNMQEIPPAGQPSTYYGSKTYQQPGHGNIGYGQSDSYGQTNGI